MEMNLSGMLLPKILKMIKPLEEELIKLFQWFSDCQIRATHDKRHFSVKSHVTMNVGGFKMKNMDCEKLFRIMVDYEIKCKDFQLVLLKS